MVAQRRGLRHRAPRLCLLTAFLGALLVPLCQANAAEKLKVVTTIFPLYDWSRQVGGDKADVMMLLPPGVEAHTYAPKPRDIARVHQADVFVWTGKHMEPWAEDILKAVENKALAVDTSQGVELTADKGHGHPFEWAGIYDLKPGRYAYVFKKGPDPAMKLVCLPAPKPGAEGIEAVEEDAEGLFGGEAKGIRSGESFAPGKALLQFRFEGEESRFILDVKDAGSYAFFTEHAPEEFKAALMLDGRLIEPTAQEAGEAEHDHAEAEGGEGHHGHHHHGGLDPHIWVDPVIAQTMVRSIANAFAQRDPANAEFYRKNAETYVAELVKLDKDIRDGLAKCKHKTIIYGGHFAFGYFARRYGLEHVSPYRGFAPDAAPTPGAVAELVEKMKALGLKTVYYEELIDPKVARVIAKETGARLALLHGAHNVSKEEREKGVTYLQIMRQNLERLKEGLEYTP